MKKYVSILSLLIISLTASSQVTTPTAKDFVINLIQISAATDTVAWKNNLSEKIQKRHANNILLHLNAWQDVFVALSTKYKDTNYEDLQVTETEGLIEIKDAFSISVTKEENIFKIDEN